MLWFGLNKKIKDIMAKIGDIRVCALRDAERIGRLECGQRPQGHRMQFYKRDVDSLGPNYTFRCASCGMMRTWQPCDLTAKQLIALAALGFPKETK